LRWSLATSAALRYDPSLQFLQLLSSLDIAWAATALALGARRRFGPRVAAGAELKLDLAFAYWRWGEIDSAKKESAKGQIENLRADVGSDFGLIEDDEIRARFLWLRSQVR